LKREELFKMERASSCLEGLSYLDTLLERRERSLAERTAGKLWPEGTHVNYDANVNTTVNKLRLALGDSPDRRLCGDDPRQGYSFVGAVSAATASAIVRNGNGTAQELREHKIPAARKGFGSEGKLGLSRAGLSRALWPSWLPECYLALRQ